MADVATAAGEIEKAGVKRRIWTRVGTRHVVIVIAGLVALVLNLAVLGAKDSRTEIVVAASSLRAGDIVSAATLRTEAIAGSGPAIDRFIPGTGMTDLVGRVVRRDIAAGDALVASDLRPIADGLRAMSIDVDPLRAAGGALAAGDVVDVISVANGVASYVAAGLDVLAVYDESGRLGSGSWAVTVAVDDEIALRIAAALAGGDVHVVRATGAPRAGASPWPPPQEP